MPSILPQMSPMFHGNPVVRCSEWQPWYPLCDPCSFPSPLGIRTVLVPISVLVPMPGEMALLQPSVYGRQSQLRHINTTYRSHTHRFQTTIHIQNTHVYTYIRIFVGFVGVGLGCVGLIGVELDDVGFGAVGLIDLCWDGFVRVGLDEVGVGVAVQGGTLEWHPEEGASRSGLGEVLQLEAKSPSVGGIKSFSWRHKVLQLEAKSPWMGNKQYKPAESVDYMTVEIYPCNTSFMNRLLLLQHGYIELSWTYA